jgi:hypothetical protein
MKIARSDKCEFKGYRDGFYLFENLGHDGLELVPEAKYVDVSANAVLFLKRDGLIEPSYSTANKFSREEITNLIKALSV